MADYQKTLKYRKGDVKNPNEEGSKEIKMENGVWAKKAYAKTKHACCAGCGNRTFLMQLHKFAKSTYSAKLLYLADPGEARGCSTNTSVIN